jgi:hypothetical protein
MQTEQSSSRRRPRVTMRMPAFSIFCLTLLICSSLSSAFTLPSPSTVNHVSRRSSSSTSTALNVWWFGGTESNEVNANDESCELVAIRIEKTSANSRRIAGDITVPVPIDDVWSILTDYDRLSIHVPNLIESKIVQRQSAGNGGDGNFRCRLFQRGAQKIIGFDFSASVTMDMTEQIVTAASTQEENGIVRQDRRINFKCVDSQFFSEFDGYWKVKEQIGPDGLETVCSYVVDVRPKGPVPVAALEWRIREDVPTNLRAVKASALKAVNGLQAAGAQIPAMKYVGNGGAQALKGNFQGRQQATNALLMMDWDRDETMAKYL